MLSEAGHEPMIRWFPHVFEGIPGMLSWARPPKGTDLIHANSWNAFAFAREGYPLVTTVHHCVRGVGYPDWKTLAQMLYHERWISGFEEKSFQVSTSVVAVSASTAADLEKYFGTRAKIINNWVDTRIYSPTDEYHKGSPSVLFVGNISRRKGGDLLPALRRSLNRNVKLHIVGGRRGNISSLEDLEPNTRLWAGLSREELVMLYQQCDVVICLSRHEGFGYTALEAMACGRPVVAFDVAGIRDVVVSGLTGTLLPCEDIAGVAAACHELIEDRIEAEKKGHQARRRAVELFSTARALGDYEQLYKTALAETK
jgi:glycosyltransferase involved in cell wall biosynthesis